MKQMCAHYSASITELKRNPTALLAESEGEAIAILNHNIPAAYLVPAEMFEMLLEKLDDFELAKVISERQSEKSKAIKVILDEL